MLYKEKLISLFKSIQRIQLTKNQKIITVTGIAVLIGLIFCIFSFIFHTESTNWEKAQNILPKDTWEVLRKKYPLEKANVIEVNDKSNHYYFIDFNNPNLCGSGGCLFLLSDNKGNELVSQLLSRQLPKNVNLFSLQENTSDDATLKKCFLIAQSSKQVNTINYKKYCHVGNTFTLINSYEKSS